MKTVTIVFSRCVYLEHAIKVEGLISDCIKNVYLPPFHKLLSAKKNWTMGTHRVLVDVTVGSPMIFSLDGEDIRSYWVHVLEKVLNAVFSIICVSNISGDRDWLYGLEPGIASRSIQGLTIVAEPIS